MARAFALAAKAVGGPDPNPPVGAVLTRDGEILGEGFTQPAGHPHAEVMAIRNAQLAGKDTQGASLYVTLEPCCHYGKTPPCTQAILEAKIKQVFLAVLDPNPLVSGKSISLLQDKGVEVFLWPKEDFLLEKHLTLMPFFFKQKYQNPVFVLKWAQTSDGFLAPQEGKSGAISSPKSHSLLQRMRRLYPIIATGAGTWMADLPKLSRRSYRNFFFKKDDFRPNSFLKELLLRYEEEVESDAYEGSYFRFFLLPKKVPLALLQKHQKENLEDNVFYFAQKNNLLPPELNQVTFWEDYPDLWEKVNQKATALGANSIFWETGPRLAEVLLKSPQAQGFFVFCSAKSSQDLGWKNPRGLKESLEFAQGKKDAFSHFGFFHRTYITYENEELHYFSKDEFYKELYY